MGRLKTIALRKLDRLEKARREQYRDLRIAVANERAEHHIQKMHSLVDQLSSGEKEEIDRELVEMEIAGRFERYNAINADYQEGQKARLKEAQHRLYSRGYV